MGTETDVAMAPVHRVTMFKIPDAANQSKLVEAYKTLGRDQKKVCKAKPERFGPFLSATRWAHTA